jgi:hypothetical protein
MWRGEPAKEKPAGARTMRARSLHAHGRAFSEPRSRLANPQGRMPGGCATLGYVSLVTFFAQAESNPLARRASGSFALGYGQKTKSKWIPAFAGMTSLGANARRAGFQLSPE